MSLEELGQKQGFFIDRNCSLPEYEEDSEIIKKAIIEEILDGEYNKQVNYYGIIEDEPDYSSLAGRNRVKISTADNCVFPDKYTNKLIYVPRDKIIHWFVLIK